MITQAEGVRSLPDCRAPDPGAQLHHLAAVGNGVPQRRGDTVTTKRQPEASMTKKRYFINYSLSMHDIATFIPAFSKTKAEEGIALYAFRLRCRKKVLE